MVTFRLHNEPIYENVNKIQITTLLHVTCVNTHLLA